MSNLEVTLSSFWQLARHWEEGNDAKLELKCEDGNLQMHMSASLGHPDKLHFPDPLPPSEPFKKKKTPSQLRRQEFRREEALSKSDMSKSFQESSDKDVPPSKDYDKENENEPINVSTESTEKSASEAAQFKCDHCTLVFKEFLTKE